MNWLKVMAFSGFQNGAISIPPARYPRTNFLCRLAYFGIRSTPGRVTAVARKRSRSVILPKVQVAGYG